MHTDRWVSRRRVVFPRRFRSPMREPFLLGFIAMAMGFPSHAWADDSFQVDLTTVQPFYVSGLGTYPSGIMPGYSQTATSNLLTIVAGTDLPNSLGAHNAVNLASLTSGDFSASVTSTLSANSATTSTGYAGFFADMDTGYAGIGYNPYGVGPNYGFGISNVSPPLTPESVSTVTLTISRSGAVMNFMASVNGGPTETVYSLTGPSVAASANFDLTFSGTPGQDRPSSVTYSDFEFTAYSPAAVSGVSGGTASNPTVLPSSAVSSVSGPIGGDGLDSSYFTFYWAGGYFSANVGVPDAADLHPAASYQFDLCSGGSCGPVLMTASADPSDAYASFIDGYLGAGSYTMGIILTGVSPDPQYVVSFDSPVIGGLVENMTPVPELSTWAMALLGFAGCAGVALRRTRARLAA